MKSLLLSANILLLVVLWAIFEGEIAEAGKDDYKYCNPKKGLGHRRNSELDSGDYTIPFEGPDMDDVSERSSDKKSGKGRKKTPVECTENGDCKKKCECRDDGSGTKYCMRLRKNGDQNELDLAE
ncbi:uncharacterized protein LOC119170616 [Rhipicephalus microplus]|uniref:uncharacterized protein LOC119170616 n=1 Tax=Rhipicephalus microplus TaxID=6941 RepID=UPI003F6C4C87